MTRMDSLIRGAVAMVLAALCLACSPVAGAERLTPAPAVSSRGVAAMDSASQGGKYLFIYFWKENDRQTKSMYGVFQNATGKMAEAADSVSVNITDPKEGAIVERYDVSRAPMPLVLAIAPNGAVTKGMPVSFDEKQLRDAVVSRGTAACLKSLQERKVVLVCVQNSTALAPFQSVRDFVADPRFAESAEMVTIDATDPLEAGFLQSLQIDPRRDIGVTVLLAPPGKPVAKFTSAVTKDQIVARMTASSSSCGPGGSCAPGESCGPGQGCAPGQSCGPNGCGPR